MPIHALSFSLIRVVIFAYKHPATSKYAGFSSSLRRIRLDIFFKVYKNEISPISLFATNELGLKSKFLLSCCSYFFLYRIIG